MLENNEVCSMTDCPFQFDCAGKNLAMTFVQGEILEMKRANTFTCNYGLLEKHYAETMNL